MVVEKDALLVFIDVEVVVIPLEVVLSMVVILV